MSRLKQQIYGTNMLHIPNIRDESNAYGLKAAEQYKLRILSVCDASDAAVMPERLKNHVDEQCKLYRHYGLPAISSSKVVYVEAEKEFLSQAICRDISDLRQRLVAQWHLQGIQPYFSSYRIDRISHELCLPVCRNDEATRRVNHKGIAQQELRKIGVRAPSGARVRSAKDGEALVRRLQDEGYGEVAFKMCYSTSGMGVFHVPLEQVAEYIEKYLSIAEAGDVLVDGWISGNITCFPNVQYYIGKQAKQDVFISCSNQIFEGIAHKGNINAIELLDKVAGFNDDLLRIRNWIRGEGGYGINGIDFIVRRENGEDKAYFLEINGRTNGCTHGAVIADTIHHTYGNHLASLEWGVHNDIAVPVGTSLHDFQAKLGAAGIAFHPQWRGSVLSSIPAGPRGVLITNTAAIEPHDKAMILAVSPSREDVCEMIEMAALLF